MVKFIDSSQTHINVIHNKVVLRYAHHQHHSCIYPLADVLVTGVVHIQIYQMFLSFNNFQLLIYDIYDYLHNIGVCCGNVVL